MLVFGCVLLVACAGAPCHWCAAYNVSNRGGIYGKPDIAAFGDQFGVAWHDPSSGQRRIYVRDYKGSWEATQSVAINGANEQDHLHIVFNDFDAGSPYGIRYRRYAYAETSGCKPVALITPSSGYHTVEEDVR